MSPTTYKVLTDSLVVFHLAFVGFVIFGGLIVLRWRWLALGHLPAVLWVIYAESTGTICPLTPLENTLRERAEMATYQGTFVDNYLMPVLYPAGLTRQMQVGIALGLIALNVVCYVMIVRRWRRHRVESRPATRDHRLLATDVSSGISPHNLPNPAAAAGADAAPAGR